MHWIPPPSKTQSERPVSHEAIAEHLDKWKTIKAEKILDVGFGRERRSTMALCQVFPHAQIDAIDNDLGLLNEELSGDENTRYLFGDADLWLPGGKDYDLIVVCHAAHALHHPLRAIKNLVEQNLKDGGHVLFVHRTDEVMQATNLLRDGKVSEKEARDILDVWEKIKQIWAEQKPHVPFELPWQARLVSKHSLIRDLCDCLGLVPTQQKHETSHDRKHTETLYCVFGLKDRQPRYQAPTYAWIQLKDRWPQYSDAKLTARVRITSYLYQKPTLSAVTHTPTLAASIYPPRILRFNFQPHEDHRGSQRVKSWLQTSLGHSLARDIRTVYFTDKTGTGDPIWGEKLPPLKGLPDNTFTQAIIQSPFVMPFDGDPFDFRVFLLPALANANAYEIKWKMPAGGTQTVGLDPRYIFIIPSLNDPSTFKKLLGHIGFDASCLDKLAEYLSKRGEWLRSNDVECAAIYYFVFRSTLLDPQNNCQAISFLARRWLEPDAVRELTNIANAYLQALLEKKTQEMTWEHQRAASGCADAQQEIAVLKKRIEEAAMLENVLTQIPNAQFEQDNASVLVNACGTLDRGMKKLRARLVLAALRQKRDRGEAVGLVYPEQLTTGNKSGDALRWIMEVADRKRTDPSSCLKAALEQIIGDAGEDSSSSANQGLIAKILKEHTISAATGSHFVKRTEGLQPQQSVGVKDAVEKLKKGRARFSSSE